MKIDNIYIRVELYDVLKELQEQVYNTVGKVIFTKTIDTHDNIMVTCPYHKNGQEHRPSAGIRKSDGIFHCFGCGEVRTFTELISDLFDVNDESFGKEWLIKNLISESIENRKGVEFDVERNKESKKAVKYVSEKELEKYRYIHSYMYQRKLTDDIIELFDIGYDKDTDCITFPVRDINGNCLFVARRSVNSKFFNYPRNVEKPLYGLYEIMQEHLYSQYDSLIVCESMIDALTCFVYGKPAVALNGTASNKQYKQLSAIPFRKLVLATDNDGAGRLARERLKKNVKGKIISEFDYSSYPEKAKDINDMSKEEFDKLREVY